jgi:hypothetical protein
MVSNNAAVAELPVPTTTEEALDPKWLKVMLAPASGGTAVRSVEIVEKQRTSATKIRFKVEFEDGRTQSFCIKGFLDGLEFPEPNPGRYYEPDFYHFVAPHIGTRTPTCISTLVDREKMLGVHIMRDLVVDGARFLTALEPYTTDQSAACLEQMALLHKEAQLLERFPWIEHRVARFVKLVPQDHLQKLLDDPRGEGVAPELLDAGKVLKSLQALADADARLPATMIHGDVHAGNIYETPEGVGIIDWQLIQRGNWSLDLAYHINAVLAVDVAEKEERKLVEHYLGVARSLGNAVPDSNDEAWNHYRAATAWGYFMWAMTRNVLSAITNTYVHRLGSAMTRHDTYRLLGV